MVSARIYLCSPGELPGDISRTDTFVFDRAFTEQHTRRTEDGLFLLAAAPDTGTEQAACCAAQQALREAADRKRTYTAALAGQVWQKTAYLRQQFSAALRQYAEPEPFFRKLVNVMPRYAELPVLTAQYREAFGTPPGLIAPRVFLPDVSVLDIAADDPLLTEPFPHGASLPDGIQASAEWHMQGYHKYTVQPEKCPYCGQEMPAPLVQALAELFDAEYTRKLRSLRNLYDLLRANVQAVMLLLRQNLQEPAPFADFAPYRRHCAELEQAAFRNLAAVQQKLAEPSRTVHWVRLRPMLEQLNRDIAVLEQAAERQNAGIRQRPEQQKRCTALIWGYLSYSVQEMTAAYPDTVSVMTAAENTARTALQTAQAALYTAEQNARQKQPTAAEMNRLLTACGETGFLFRQDAFSGSLRFLRQAGGEPPGAAEQQFAAFLYFYRQAMADTPPVLVLEEPFAALGDETGAAVFRMVCELAENCAEGGIFVLQTEHPDHREAFLRRYGGEVLL